MPRTLARSFTKSVSPESEPQTLSEFVQTAYGELRRIAQIYFKSEQPGRALQPTGLVRVPNEDRAMPMNASECQHLLFSDSRTV
jgi:hypothetical protein